MQDFAAKSLTKSVTKKKETLLSSINVKGSDASRIVLSFYEKKMTFDGFPLA